jgi:micrococcal nuclease
MTLLQLFPKLFLLLLSLSFYGNANETATEITGKVIAVKDGDTIKILYNGKQLTIRLAHIDCPEKKQPFGMTAKQFTSSKCYGQMVTIQHENKYDRNKRLIGVVINAKGENINAALVKAGLAWHFKKYSTQKEYAVLENTARQNKIGLWADKNPVAPWDWRKRSYISTHSN